MSILKQVLGEALRSLFQRSSTDEFPTQTAEPRSIHPGDKQQGVAERPATSQSGMKAVILNWKAGENDPFTVVNTTIQQHFRACGKNVEVIEITEPDWTERLAALAPAGVEFAFTWQGLGSSVTVDEHAESLWDRLRIPLICVHADHPSHMPLNHQLESQYCFHLYTNADFARYSNRHFRRLRSASIIDFPQLFREPRLGRRAGDYFVFAKNINDPIDTERAWRNSGDEELFNAYMIAAETLKALIAREPYVEIHDVLDDLIVERKVEWLNPATNIAQYHQYHSQLDHYLRSHKSIVAVTSVRDFPLRIYGRGWDRIARDAPASHVFHQGRNMADSQDLYYTRFGLLDVSPSKGLHDRTRRAMANGGGFLSSANLEDSFTDIKRFNRLFFSLGAHELPEKCEAIVRDPDAHLDMAQQFADMYHNRFHLKDFVARIDQLAKLAGRF